jgi:uncharacterized repeat protein (TIGR01451 family)
MNTIVKRRSGGRPLAAAAILALVPRLLVAAPDIALRMTVDTAVPAAGQPVEFTITASNVGADAATGVQVTDQLPAELRIPTGMAAFPSAGTYDPITGIWSIESLAVGGNATLVIPAVVAVATQPPCSVNVAESRLAADTNTSNDRAVAVVKRSLADRCVDLAVVASHWNVSGCDSWYRLEYKVSVTNFGPDDATDVFVDMTQTPHVVPHLVFGGDACSGSRCTIATLAAGESRTFKAESDPIDINERKNVIFDFAISSADTDYATSNNQRRDNTIVPRTPSCDYGDEDTGGIVVGGCFIATAAYGSPLEPHVKALREFRDRYLRRSAPGRAFIRFYYRHSPPVAAFIARHESLRFAVRALLTPLVLLIEYPFWAGTLLMVALAAPLTRHRLTRQEPGTAGRAAPLK